MSLYEFIEKVAHNMSNQSPQSTEPAVPQATHVSPGVFGLLALVPVASAETLSDFASDLALGVAVGLVLSVAMLCLQGEPD